MDYLWKVSSKAKEMLSQKEDTAGNQPETSQTEASPSSTSPGNNEKPISSLSLETHPGSSDKEENEAASSQSPITSPVEGETNQNPDGSDRSNIKIGLSAGDLKNVSTKAVDSAKSIGSFLYGFANKTGRTLSESATKLKTSVAENSIVGNFNKEDAGKPEENKGPGLPWAGAEDEENVKQQILTLSADRRNFLRNPPAGVIFEFDFEAMQPIAKLMLSEDPELENVKAEVVPKLVTEETFWRNYFYRVSLLKQPSRRKMSTKKGSMDSPSTSEGESGGEDNAAAEDYEGGLM